MKRTMRWVGVALLFSLCLGVAGVRAQQPLGAEPSVPSRAVHTPSELVPALPVPRLMKLTGALKDEQGKARTGVVGVTFAVYKEQEGGATLWLETQNVELDEQGRYTVLLGSTKSEGLPLELFTSGEPRWLGVQVNLAKELEQARVLLVSVPYALKAVDAETLGGKPLSSFMLATPQSESGPDATKSVKPGARTAAGAATIGGGGTQNFVAKFDATGANVINSGISDNGSRINAGEGIDFSSDFSFVGNAEPAATGRVQMFDRAFVGFVIRGLNVLFETLQGNPAVPTEAMRVTQSGNVGIGTPTPAAKLDVAGTGNFTATTPFTVVPRTGVLRVSQSGDGDGIVVSSATSVNGAALYAAATNATTNATTFGVLASAASTGGVGVSGSANGNLGTGVLGSAFGPGGRGVVGQAGIDTNSGLAVFGSASNISSVAGQFGNENGGNILIGTGLGVANVFRVDGTGKVFANGGFACPNPAPAACLSTGSADFAEAVESAGERNAYEPGDVLVIDSTAKRRVALASEEYSTRVAGIYSTRPAVLGGAADEETLKSRVPLAMVGIVPCKVTAENGPIAPGDLLVTSLTPGHAMKGTNRARMLGAVVGKALEPLPEGKGVIQVLVTLQ